MAIKMLTKFPDFQKYSVQEVMHFTTRVREFEPRSDFSPAYIPSLYNFDGGLKFSELNGNLVAMYLNPEVREPEISIYGNNKMSQTLKQIFLFQKEKGIIQIVTGLEAAQIKAIDDVSIDIIETPDSDEYILSTKDHKELMGSALAEERKAVRNFIKNYGDDIKIFELDLSKHNSVELIVNALHVWKQYFKSTNNDPDSVERQYISLFLMHADELPTRNVVISHADQVIGFILYDVIEEYSCAIGHSLKVEYAYNHAFDFALHVLSNRLYSDGIKYLNIEEDMGISGLRAKKNHLMPVKKLLRYSALPTS